MPNLFFIITGGNTIFFYMMFYIEHSFMNDIIFSALCQDAAGFEITVFINLRTQFQSDLPIKDAMALITKSWSK
jgi:hypothetical protein